MRICIVATDGRSLIDFRGKLIQSLQEKGHEVVCVSIEPNEEMRGAIHVLGASYEQVAGDRVSISVFGGLRMIRAYVNMFKRVRPDVCLLYMSKPIAFGGIAAAHNKVPHINILVNGLENAYYQHGLKDLVVRVVMSTLYRYVSSRSEHVFMQNIDDRQYFIDHRIAKEQSIVLVNGSGVDMEYYAREPLPDEPVFLMVARLLWTKGIREYLEAIPLVKEKCPEARFMLVGGLDQSAEGLSEEELNRCVNENDIEYCGFANDVRPYLKRCSVFVLPSYHEGTPRSVLEAMATGRAIITTDAPGCRETVISGQNGYLVSVGNSGALAERMVRLANDADARKLMGQRSYVLCKERFEVNKVNQVMIDGMMEDL